MSTDREPLVRGLTRRELAAGSAVAASGILTEGTLVQPRLRLALNTAVVRSHRLDLAEIATLAGKAGYKGIEVWVDEIERHLSGGGSPKDLRSRISDAGLTAEGAIAFGEWAVDDPSRRARGLEQFRRDMDRVSSIGGRLIAAPPTGMTDSIPPPVEVLADRYRTILEIGRETGVVPQLEIWGFSRTLGRLSEAVAVALETGHRDACVLADAYHMHKGGSSFAGLRLLNGAAMHVFHLNDWPADPPRAMIRDSDRVFPGDGVGPIAGVVADLEASGFRGSLSLELFNPNHARQDPAAVIREGLRKMQAVVRRARALPR